MPPVPKRKPARRNQHATKATLTLLHDVEEPELPDSRMWHRQTLQWWADVWASPMAPEYDESDQHGLFVLAVLIDDFWKEPTSSKAAEIRLQRQCFGLSPIDRRRLQWEIERGEEAEERSQRRRTQQQQPEPGASSDALSALRAV